MADGSRRTSVVARSKLRLRRRSRQCVFAIARWRQLHSTQRMEVWRAHPAVTSAVDREELVKRLAWYAPRQEVRGLVGGAATELLCAERSDNVGSEDGDPSDSNAPVRSGVRSLVGGSKELVLIWKTESTVRTACRVIWNPGARIVDPHFLASCEANTYLRLQYYDVWSVEQRNQFARESSEKLEQLVGELGGTKRVNVMGTGPSLGSVLDLDLGVSVSIMCNSVVRSDALLAKVRPQILAFADPVFHFGVSEYAAQFRRDLRKVVDEIDPWLIVPAESAPVLLAHMPELAPKLVALDVRRSGRFNIPIGSAPWVRRTGNVLTQLMLPVALSLSNSVGVLGCDGRDPADLRFWQHNEGAQYGELYETVVEMHPSFFDDNDYVQYYVTHCEVLTEFIEWAERMNGASFESVTSSHIPVLRERQGTRH